MSQTVYQEFRLDSIAIQDLFLFFEVKNVDGGVGG